MRSTASFSVTRLRGDIMSNVIEELYYGNLEPQELTTEITPKLKKKLSVLAKKE